ncbi:hypothetical protein ATO6_04260 [Oceanicola sp. 22II-s10i]|nr:hypothetical protein ATO6_04260 [Oceanicola sp. 22II-s10i]
MLRTTLCAVTALTLAGTAAQAQSGFITKSEIGIAGAPGISDRDDRLSAPTGDPFISVIVLDRASGDLKLCGSYQNDENGRGVRCGPLPANSEAVEPKQQSLWEL